MFSFIETCFCNCSFNCCLYSVYLFELDSVSNSQSRTFDVTGLLEQARHFVNLFSSYIGSVSFCRPVRGGQCNSGFLPAPWPRLRVQSRRHVVAGARCRHPPTQLLSGCKCVFWPTRSAACPLLPLSSRPAARVAAHV